MISFIINIFLILIAAVGFVVQIVQILVDENKRNKKFFQRITTAGKWGISVAILMFVVGSASLIVNERDKRQTVKSDSTRYQKLNNRFDSLKNSFNGKLDSTVYRMSYQFGLGVNENIKNGKENTSQIIMDALSNKKELAHVIDSMRHKLDSLSTASEPHIAYYAGRNSGFKAEIKNGIFTITGWVNNDGQANVYGLTLDTKILFTYNDTLWKDKYLMTRSIEDYDLSPDRATAISGNVKLPETIYTKITSFAFIIKGDYYLDNNRENKNKRTVHLKPIVYFIEDTTCSAVNANPDSLLKQARMADFLYR